MGRLVEFRFKGPPGTPLSPLTSSGQRNCASWASQTQKSFTLLPCPGGRTTKSTRTCGGIGQKRNLHGQANLTPSSSSSSSSLAQQPLLSQGLLQKLPQCLFLAAFLQFFSPNFLASSITPSPVHRLYPHDTFQVGPITSIMILTCISIKHSTNQFSYYLLLET